MATKEAANGASQSEEEVVNTTDQPQATPTQTRSTIKPVLVKPINILLDPEKPEDYYQLRMTNLAMQTIEDTLGINLWQGLGGIQNIRARQIAVMVWACLQWKFPDITLEEVQILPGMDISNYLYVVTTVDSVIYGNLPEPDPNAKETDESDPNANPSVGSNSGQSDS